MVSEGFITGPVPAPKDHDHEIKWKGRRGWAVWDKNRWMFVWVDPAPRSLAHFSQSIRLKYARYGYQHEHTKHARFSSSKNPCIEARRRIVLPPEAWDRMAYHINEESLVFKEFYDLITRRKVCPDCQQQFEFGVSHVPGECESNVVKDVMEISRQDSLDL